jgi:hypothetical protein
VGSHLAQIIGATPLDLSSPQALPANQPRGGPPQVKGKPLRGGAGAPPLTWGPGPPQPPKTGEGLGESGLGSEGRAPSQPLTGPPTTPGAGLQTGGLAAPCTPRVDR